MFPNIGEQILLIRLKNSKIFKLADLEHFGTSILEKRE